jgi:iron(III) transport system permease protein
MLAAWVIAGLLLGLALLPHAGIVLLSLSEAWSLSSLPTRWTADHYAEVLVRTPHFVWNTLRYALLAAGVDVVLGAAIAWLLVRGGVRGRGLLEGMATVPLAIPGVVLAIGYLRVFHGSVVPGLGTALTASWLILVVAYAVRRLPYTVRASYAALEPLHPSMEESAQSLGATPARAVRRIALPLMTRGLVAGGLIAFLTSAGELSSTILLVPRIELAPLSYGIYVSMQSAAGRGPGAALCVVAIVLVAAGAWLVGRVTARDAGSAFRL